MAKKTTQSQQSRSSSSPKATAEASPGKMVLKVQENDGIRRSARLSGIEVKRPLSVKTSKPKQKKKSTKVGSKIPKKPPTAFFYFLEDFRKEFQEQNPDVKTMRDIGKACGEKWKTMAYEDKVQYYDIATEKRAEFEKALAEYTERKESGEHEETEEEDEEDWCA